ncbi:MAG: ORF6N domain-containing protein [Monoglobales bacterium]
MNEMVSICGTDIQFKEYQGQRVVTFKDIDAVHHRPKDTARRNFKQNRKHFIEGEDYFIVRPGDKENSQKSEFWTLENKENILMDEIRPLENKEHSQKSQIDSLGFKVPNRGLTLITESGYLMIVKSFNDDLAWKVQRELVNNYFRVKNVVNEVKHDSGIQLRPLTSDDYIDAGKAIAKCDNRRLPLVLDMFRKAGFEIEQISLRNDTKRSYDEVRNAHREELVKLLSKYDAGELQKMFPEISRQDLYRYRKGEYVPQPERYEMIIERLNDTAKTYVDECKTAMTPEEHLDKMFSMLNVKGQKMAMKEMLFFASLPEFKKGSDKK